MAPVVCVLHHHIGAESVFERGLGVTSSRCAYEAQIARLVTDYDVIDLETLISGRLPKRPLLMTFDDVFASVLGLAQELLAPRRLPAVFFVNPGLLGQQKLSLDASLAWAANTVGLARLTTFLDLEEAAGVGEVIARDMAHLGVAERARVQERIVTAFGTPDLHMRAPPLKEADLKSLVDLGIEIGNHTMTHVHGRALSEPEIEQEVVHAKRQLEALSGTRVRAFSLPYGNERDLTPTMLAAIRRSGHEAIFLVHARSNSLRPAPDIWYRTSLRDERTAVLNLRLRYLPLLRSFKHRVLG